MSRYRNYEGTSVRPKCDSRNARQRCGRQRPNEHSPGGSTSAFYMEHEYELVEDTPPRDSRTAGRASGHKQHQRRTLSEHRDKKQQNYQTYSFEDSDSWVLVSEKNNPQGPSQSHKKNRGQHSNVSKEYSKFNPEVTRPVHSQAKGVIGVFWDIGNCAVPRGKSPREIVKKIRDTFYGGRKEESFIVACDIMQLSATTRKELTGAHVDLLHVDSDQKNAADVKLRDYLRKFVETPKPEGSCVVLISGDVDFSSELHNIRYRNQIYVVLIHNRNAKVELRDNANKAVLFEDFVGDISTVKADMPKVKKDTSKVKTQYLLLKKVPQNIAGKTFLALKDKVPSLNGTLETKIENGCCLMAFPDKDDASRAFSYFMSNKLNFFGTNACYIRRSSGFDDWDVLQLELEMKRSFNF